MDIKEDIDSFTSSLLAMFLPSSQPQYQCINHLIFPCSGDPSYLSGCASPLFYTQSIIGMVYILPSVYSIPRYIEINAYIQVIQTVKHI